MECINCGEESEQRLCKQCRETSPYSDSELDTFLGLLTTFGDSPTKPKPTKD